MSQVASLKERLRYAFDNSMSRGTIALVGWLAVATFVFLFGMATLMWVGGFAQENSDGTPMNLLEVMWFGLMRTLDSGTMGGDEGPVPFLLASLTITLGGVFIVSTLIGVLTSGIEAKIEELRKGRSRVIESDHTVILGWSSHVFSIIPELVAANANKKDACIVILSNLDKVEMEDAIRDRVGNTRSTRVVCRSGSPIELGDLDMVSVQTSRAIIAIAPEGAEDPDTDIIKTILAITNGPNRRKAPYHIVAEVQDPANMEAAKMVGRDECELILAGDLISRVMVQTCRQSGLSVVHLELLDFGGDEIYFKREPGLAGRTFGDALFAYADSTLIGLRHGDGRVRVNPPMDLVIAADDVVIAVSEDDDTIRLSAQKPVLREDAIRTGQRTEPRPERTLLLGWNWKAPRIVAGLDAYVAEGSLVAVLAETEDAEAELDAACTDLRHLTVSCLVGDTTNRRTLEGMDIPSYDHIIVLCSDRIDAQRADARVLVTLLHLRDMGEKLGHEFSIVSEMLDVRNRTLAEVTKADDFIVSEKLVSLMLAQVSENKQLNEVFIDLFDPDGSEIYVKPVSDYVALGQPVNFYTVVEAARRRGEIALGYRLAAQARDASVHYGVVVNPDKAAEVTFAARDRLVVIAES